MTAKPEVELYNFFVFNSSLGQQEGEEHQKIVYYYPRIHDEDTQIKNVGLVEAIIQFTSTFKPSSDVHSLHTMKRRQLYFQPEENYWIVMTINVPCVSKPKDNTNISEYLDGEVQDNVYESVLKQAYFMYRLFNGNFRSNVDIINLKKKLLLFFEDYLENIKLTHCDILNVFNGIQFLPLDKQTFLKVQCFINLLECNFPEVEHTSFLYNEHLTWSGIEPSDMQVIYQYLISSLLPQHVKSELFGGSITRQKSPFTLMHHGKFITGPSDLKAQNFGKVPKINLFSTEEKSYYLLVYRALSASVCLFIKDTTEFSMDYFKKLDDFLGAELTPIVSDIAEYCNKQVVTPSNVTETSPRFIYFNKLNLAYKSTAHLDNKQTGNYSCPTESIKIMSEMNRKKSVLGQTGETIVKTMNDYWVVGKISNLREFYVALQTKNASLIDISEEIKKLCETELKGIYFQSL